MSHSHFFLFIDVITETIANLLKVELRTVGPSIQAKKKTLKEEKKCL